MRRPALAIALAGAVLALAGCAQSPAEAAQARAQAQVQRAQAVRSFADAGVAVWTDPDTGCQYLVRGGTGIAPRWSNAGEGYSTSQRLSRVRGCR